MAIKRIKWKAFVGFDPDEIVQRTLRAARELHRIEELAGLPNHASKHAFQLGRDLQAAEEKK